MGIVTFLRPQGTSSRVWAFGNNATCRFAAFVIQASTAGIWYQGMLSIYFLLTTRYGMKNAIITKRIEPLMHLLALGYPIASATTGLAKGITGEIAGGASCHVSLYDNSDVSKSWELQEKSVERAAFMFIFAGIPMIGVALCLVCTQLSIYFFVRHHTRKHRSNESGSSASNDVNVPSTKSATSNGDASFGSSGRSIPPMDLSQGSSSIPTNDAQALGLQSSSKRNEKQTQRLQLVCSQALLFVMSFVMCNGWNVIIIQMQSSARTRAEEMEMVAKYYLVFVIQAILLPRPKYLMLRLEFPDERRLWTARRMFLGDKLLPTAGSVRRLGTHVDIAANRQNESDGDAPVGDKLASKSFQHRMVSSLTACDGDFDDGVDGLGEDERWHNVSTNANQGTQANITPRANHRSTSLEAISELSESYFELTPYQANGSYLSAASIPSSTPKEPSESRWRGTGSTPLRSPFCGSSGSIKSDASDLPIQVPTRRKSGSSSSRSSGSRKPDSDDVFIRVPRRRESGSSSSRSNGSRNSDKSDLPIRAPRRRESGSSSSRSNGSRKSDKSDLPIQAPKRRESGSSSSRRSGTRKSGTPDLPIQVPSRRESPISAPRQRDFVPRQRESPISVPKPTWQAPIDSPTRSCNSASDYSPVQERTVSGGKQAFDLPLALPSRFVSLSPSEIEDDRGIIFLREKGIE
ncbi:unnamed protein product [Cylindrotheca closterium]|uniref:Uncharacterized protein n=1 Tax=Cylindrotheca closterium TaxID=2856 RepID=A0AAD2FLY1_9STRA|nr:unnamed protein product [Cylindrotheca closterium]